MMVEESMHRHSTDTLVRDYISGEAGPEELAELNMRLPADSELADHLVGQAWVDVLLTEMAQRQAAAETVLGLVRAERNRIPDSLRAALTRARVGIAQAGAAIRTWAPLLGRAALDVLGRAAGLLAPAEDGERRPMSRQAALGLVVVLVVTVSLVIVLVKQLATGGRTDQVGAEGPVIEECVSDDAPSVVPRLSVTEPGPRDDGDLGVSDDEGPLKVDERPVLPAPETSPDLMQVAVVPEEDAGDITFTVGSGDNFWRISKKVYGGKRNYFREIARFNRLDEKAVLQVGMTIKIPRIEGAGKEGIEEEPPEGAVYYTVQEGDSFWSVAGKLLDSPLRAQELQALNPGVRPKGLRPGQRILVPQT